MSFVNGAEHPGTNLPLEIACLKFLIIMEIFHRYLINLD